jgi:hypothetical protein
MPILDRTKLSSSDKRDLLAKTIACQAHGDISFLADEYKLSRKTIYQTRHLVDSALNELVAEHDEPDVIARVDVDVQQLRRTIVTLAITAPNSIRAIEEQIPLIYPGCKVSYGYIQGVIVEAQIKARQFNQTVSLANINSVALDEMFSQGEPVLAGIDLDSGFLFSLSHQSSRDGETWAQVLNDAKSQQMQPLHVVKDGAKGMAKGVDTVFENIEQRDDVFHAIYLAGKAKLLLEHRAYRHITSEFNAQKACEKKSVDNKKSKAKSLDWAKRKCADAVNRYSFAEQAVKKIRAAFLSLDLNTGKLLTGEASRQLLTEAVVLLRQTDSYHCLSVARYVENRLSGLTLACSHLHVRLLQLCPDYSPDTVSLACRFFERQRKLKKMSRWQRQKVTIEMLGAYKLIYAELAEEKADELMAKVSQMLATRHMASSAIEGFNATLRSYLYVRKGVNQGFLDLFQAWQNLRPRRWGRHQGTSAYEILTGNKIIDWLNVLGFPLSKASH